MIASIVPPAPGDRAMILRHEHLAARPKVFAAMTGLAPRLFDELAAETAPGWSPPAPHAATARGAAAPRAAGRTSSSRPPTPCC